MNNMFPIRSPAIPFEILQNIKHLGGSALVRPHLHKHYQAFQSTKSRRFANYAHKLKMSLERKKLSKLLV